MNTYFISDNHFDHEKIIKYCDRPFENVNQMNEVMIKNWNKVIKNGDVVYILGDFALASKNRIKELVSNLNGDKRLVLGNHDKYSVKQYYEFGFNRVYDKPILYNDFYILSHEPQYVRADGVYANIFGHVHNNPQYKNYSNRHFIVCVENINYTPISFENIVKMMESYETQNNGTIN